VLDVEEATALRLVNDLVQRVRLAAGRAGGDIVKGHELRVEKVGLV